MVSPQFYQLAGMGLVLFIISIDWKIFICLQDPYIYLVKDGIQKKVLIEEAYITIVHSDGQIVNRPLPQKLANVDVVRIFTPNKETLRLIFANEDIYTFSPFSMKSTHYVHD